MEKKGGGGDLRVVSSCNYTKSKTTYLCVWVLLCSSYTVNDAKRGVIHYHNHAVLYNFTTSKASLAFATGKAL